MAGIIMGRSFGCRMSGLVVISGLLMGCTQSGATGPGGMGSKETAGTGIGVLAGGLAGAFLGKGSGKVVAVLAGATVGGLVGNRIGAMLDAQDQKELQARAQQALLTQADNAPLPWSSSHTGATATIAPVNTRVETRAVRLVRDPKVAAAPQLDMIGAKYAAKEPVKVRLAPSEQSDVVETLPKGSFIWAIGVVVNQPWIMVARHGKAIGYVISHNVAPAKSSSATSQIAARAPSHPGLAGSSYQDGTAFDLDSDVPVRTAADLDALGPTEKADMVTTSVTCRDINTTVSARGRTETNSQTACKSPDGAWQLD